MGKRIDLDLGDGHTLRFASWDPDLALNPQYAHLAGQLPVERYGAIVTHTRPDDPDGICEGAVTFASDVQRDADPNATTWTVESWDPLTVSPSLLCHCGDHGFIREGRWVRA